MRGTRAANNTRAEAGVSGVGGVIGVMRVSIVEDAVRGVRSRRKKRPGNAKKHGSERIARAMKSPKIITSTGSENARTEESARSGRTMTEIAANGIAASAVVGDEGAEGAAAAAGDARNAAASERMSRGRKRTADETVAGKETSRSLNVLSKNCAMRTNGASSNRLRMRRRSQRP